MSADINPYWRPFAPRADCGTLAAARRHRRDGEPVCNDCLDAERTYNREHRADRVAGDLLPRPLDTTVRPGQAAARMLDDHRRARRELATQLAAEGHPNYTQPHRKGAA